MGSFNTTCFASGQTIAPGERCHLVPLLQQSSYQMLEGKVGDQPVSLTSYTHSTCYAHAFWLPAGPLIDVKYDDYGQFELDDSTANKNAVLMLLEHLSQTAVTLPLGENQFHDVAVDIAGFIAEKCPALHSRISRNEKAEATADQVWQEMQSAWEHLWTAFQEHRLFAVRRGAGEPPRPFAFAVIHGHALDALMETSSRWTSWDNEPLDPRSVYDRMLAKGLQEKAYLHPEDLKSPTGMHTAMYRIEQSLRDNLQAIGELTGVGYHWERRIRTLIAVQLLAGDTPEDRIYQQWLNFVRLRYMLAAMDSMNLKLSPMVYNGQDYDNEVGRAYAKFVRTVCAKVSRGRR